MTYRKTHALVYIPCTVVAFLGPMLIGTASFANVPSIQVPAPGFYPIIPIAGGGIRIAGSSDDGTVVAGMTSNRLFLWNAQDGIRYIDTPVGQRIRGVSAISGDGSTVGVRIDDGFPTPAEAYLWSDQYGYERIGRLSTDSSDDSYVGDLNFDGSIAVGFSEAGRAGGSGYRWIRGSGIEDLDTEGISNAFYDPRSSASGVSDDGSIIVGSTTVVGESSSQVGRWTESDGWQVIGSLPASPRNAGGSAMSADGSIIVGTNQGNGFDGIIWDEEDGLRALPRMQATNFVYYSASQISGDGGLIGGLVIDNEGEFRGRGLIWEKSGDDYQPILLDDFLRGHGFDLGLLETWSINSISPDGRKITGLMRASTGGILGYMAVLPVPEPSAIALALPAFLWCGFSSGTICRWR